MQETKKIKFIFNKTLTQPELFCLPTKQKARIKRANVG